MAKNELLRLSAQVQGLEVALKALIALHYAERGQGPGGFAAAANAAQQVCEGLQAQVRSVYDSAPPTVQASGLAAVMLDLVAETVGRCFLQPASEFERHAEQALAAYEPPSQARN
ncbi:hypothetical protein LRS10_21800 [Phenylobacterium sp. J426]|uniref:hypothetical protein n=1 Tax=Phenylobacterium sp. J426 TaxID=2898439 RepID=UPI0021508AE7|nr:hypothetical protein [Phenylobacterium sp. J426]MCR5876546.1 hypothetical protein [Phenylobacterium sp. J426]